MTQNEPAIRLRDVAFRWPGTDAFSITVHDFQIAAGTSVLLLGESGSGKSTLLSLICGIFKPDRGSVAVCGTELTGLSAVRRDRFRADNIGVIFQMFNLLPYATALDNVVLPLHFAPKRRSNLSRQPKAAALALLTALGLDAQMIGGRSASRLSVGQQQRVAVARALIGAPALIIADEPTSALDADNQAVFLDLLFEQTAKANATLLMVSHDRRLSERFDMTLDLADIAKIERKAA